MSGACGPDHRGGCHGKSLGAHMVTISLPEVTALDAAQNLLVLSSVHSLLGGHGFYAFAYLTYLVSPDAARPPAPLF